MWTRGANLREFTLSFPGPRERRLMYYLASNYEQWRALRDEFHNWVIETAA